MNTEQINDFAHILHAVGEALRASRLELNAADPINANHGDHMVEVFEVAAQAAGEAGDASLADAMQAAAAQLASHQGNASAQMYARGLEQIAQQFRRYEITLDDLLGYVRKALAADGEGDLAPTPRAGETLKALVSGLVGWKSAEAAVSNAAPGPDASGDAPANPGLSKPLELGALFDLGVAYMQAKARGGERSQVLADAAASASPLAQTPHRYQSGKLAIRALLEAINAGQ